MTAPQAAPPIKTSNTYEILDRDIAEVGPSSESPREPQKEKRMPLIVAKFKIVSDKEIKMLQACTKKEIKFEYMVDSR